MTATDGPTAAQRKRWQRRVDKAAKALTPGWRVHVLDVFPDDEDVWALSHSNPDIHDASISFAPNWEEDEHADETVVHELMHVLHGEVDDFFHCRVLPLIAEDKVELVNGLYHDFVERYTDTLTKVITPMLPPF